MTTDASDSDQIRRLTDPDTHIRRLAAAELGDLLRHNAFDDARTEAVAAALVDLVLTDHDPVVTEEALNSISDAFDHRELPLRVVESLTRRMPSLPPVLLDYALNVLACTHDPAARAMIEQYLTHPDGAVRNSAQEAMVELPGRPGPV